MAGKVISSLQLKPDDRILRERYRLLEAVKSGDPAAGLPTLWRVSDGVSLGFAKIWQDDPAFPEVQSIWTHEVRSLLRLGGLPSSDEVFVRLRELGDDPAGFVVILDADGREPLTTALADRGRHSWLADLRTARARRRVWMGLLRVARGLALMHSEGTLHRMLSADSVFTDLDGACDFRLSGFEWSLRVAPIGGGFDIGPFTAPELSEPASQYSVASDWFAFGLLCAQILIGAEIESAKPDQLLALRKVIERSGLPPAERRVIKDLIDPDPERRTWHASDITETIGDLIEALTNERSESKQPLYVGFDVGRDSSLSKQIAKASEGAVSVRDAEAKLAFIVEDLGLEPQISTRLQPFPHYVLHGAKINYQLKRWSAGATASWDAALCTQQDAHPAIAPNQTYRFPGRRIEARSSAWIAENIRSVRRLGDAWHEALPIEAPRRPVTDEQARVVQFFQVTNQLEALLTIAQIWPVRIVSTGEVGERLLMDVTPTIDPDRDQLAKLLGVPTAAEQMQRLFQADDVVGRRAAEQKYAFGSEGRLSRREAEKPEPWLFVGYRDSEQGPLYQFSRDAISAPFPSGDVFLRPWDLAGSSVLLHRRKKAIEDLAAHRSLLDAIEDPASAKRSTTEGLRDSDAVRRLDPSKRLALSEISRSQPFYLLQGPPGTGKTTLVATMLAEQAATSSSSQILVTAQNHASLDVVMNEAVKAIALADGCLAIRLDSTGEFGRRATGARLASTLTDSVFGSSAPSHLKERLSVLRDGAGAAGAAERSGFERLVEEGAALIFATTNSGDLARLLQAGRRYDWSIVEEAGRAHGFDLALPLQASHRILMIGDQEQLPAFNIDALHALLSDPTKVLAALRHGSRYAPTLIERYRVKEASSNPDRFEEDCATWRTLLPFFRTMFDRCHAAGEADGEVIARQLVHQHRMHPDIRRIVAECFYPKLEDADEQAMRFPSAGEPVDVVENSWMRDERIVFVDVPYIQRGRNARGEEVKPRYTAPVEVEAVLRVIEQFRKNDAQTGGDCKMPSLQILSPYRAQVRAIRTAIRKTKAQGGLRSLEEFANDGSEIGATVDEFQGNQADLIIVSLVRNNHAKPGKGVGFLTDGRRWNVLLSRAKRKLVLVGSWDFLSTRFPENAILFDEDPMAGLAKVMRALQAAIDRREAARIDFATTSRETPARSVSRRSRRAQRGSR